MDDLDLLESESIYILREVAAEFERPVLLYSMGKDSSVLAHLAQKAFAPGKIPFPFLHIDTGYKFKEMYSFRDKTTERFNVDLIVHSNKKAMAQKANPWDLGTSKCCQLLKTQGLVQALQEGNFQAALGAARRDEEKSRAKERIFSFRDEFGQWDPKNQRPELWSLYNTKIGPQESIRVFPLSNWTEMNVWRYIEREQIPVVPLYFAKKRRMVREGDLLIPENKKNSESAQEVLCRYRTLGCSPCTGAVESQATTVAEVISEMMEFSTSERKTRIIDHDSNHSMEDKKREGYF